MHFRIFHDGVPPDATRGEFIWLRRRVSSRLPYNATPQQPPHTIVCLHALRDIIHTELFAFFSYSARPL